MYRVLSLIFLVFFPALLCAGLFSACAPDVRPEFTTRGAASASFSDLLMHPSDFKGGTFVFGGTIVSNESTARGSLLEAVYVPLSDEGLLQKESGGVQGKFLALYPGGRGALDPAKFREGSDITIMGVFTEMRTGIVNGTDYFFPFFEILEIHLWEEPGKIPSWYAPYPFGDPYLGPALLKEPFWGDRPRPAWR
ncbi:MAG: Slp family lipoprotein [Thermodesulfovibrionales bacterium]